MEFKSYRNPNVWNKQYFICKILFYGFKWITFVYFDEYEKSRGSSRWPRQDAL